MGAAYRSGHPWMLKSCHACQEVKQSPPIAPLHPWLWPLQQWKIIHVDFASLFMGGSYLIIVDAHYKCPVVHHMSTTTAAKTIQVHWSLFARYGTPEQLISNNGPQLEFVSSEWCMTHQMLALSPLLKWPSGKFRTFKQQFMQVKEPQDQRLKKYWSCTELHPCHNWGATLQVVLGHELRTRLHLLYNNWVAAIVRKKTSFSEYTSW